MASKDSPADRFACRDERQTIQAEIGLQNVSKHFGGLNDVEITRLIHRVIQALPIKYDTNSSVKL